MVSARPSNEALAALSPLDATGAYYDWYLDMLAPDVLCHPLLDRAYEDSPYLSSALIASLDERVTDACDLGMPEDPFLCSVEVPVDVSIYREYWVEDEATVIVRGEFPTESDRLDYVTLGRVNLVREGGHWSLDSVDCY